MNTTPKWFTAVAVVALLWNIIGLIAVIMNMLLTPEQIAAMPTEQQTLLEDAPLWSTLASLLAVSTGTLGCLALLFKKSWAVPLFMLSIAGLVVQDIALFVVLDAIKAYGIFPLIMQGIVMVIAIALLMMGQKAKREQWLS